MSGSLPERTTADVGRRAGDHSHHVVCRRCGRTEDVDPRAGKSSCLEPVPGHGFAIDGAEVVFRGLCPACAADDPAGTPSDTTAPATSVPRGTR
jgi:Fur family transcriptional regulator, stress-responsive regulator